MKLGLAHKLCQSAGGGGPYRGASSTDDFQIDATSALADRSGIERFTQQRGIAAGGCDTGAKPLTTSTVHFSSRELELFGPIALS